MVQVQVGTPDIEIEGVSGNTTSQTSLNINKGTSVTLQVPSDATWVNDISYSYQ